MLSKKTQGVWCEKDRRWYYLETNGHATTQPIEIIKRKLIVKDLIGQNINKTTDFKDWKLMKYEEAREKGFEIVALYLNKHIKESMVEQKEVNDDPWA